MSRFGFIGTGHMGCMLAEAVGKNFPPSEILLSNRTRAKAEALAQKLGCRAADNAAVAKEAEYLFLCVKPQTMPGLFSEISPILRGRVAANDRFILVTPAAGLTMAAIEKLCGVPVPVIRIMPNTPLAVGEGLILCAANERVTKEELSLFFSALQGTGRVDLTEESGIDAAGIITGCGPAYVFRFMEALAAAGEKLGVSPDKAKLYAGQTVLGAAKLALSSGDSLGSLCDAVCSPGGTTIEGVKALDRGGMTELVSAAVSASYRRTLELSRTTSRPAK